MSPSDVTKFNIENVYTGKSEKGYGFTYFARKNFKKGDTVMRGIGKVIDHQTAHCSVQIAHNKHYLPTKWTGKYWNHSCDANTHVKTREDGFPNLVAFRNIRKDEEITYSYWMTEHAWTKGTDELKVKCKCGSKNCTGRILSYSDLSRFKQAHLKRKLLGSHYLLEL